MEPPTDELTQKGLAALLVALVTGFGGLVGWRGFHRIRDENARDNRVSRLEDNLQVRNEELLARNSELRDELDVERKLRADAERELRTARDRIRALLGQLSPAERAAAVRWMPSQLEGDK